MVTAATESEKAKLMKLGSIVLRNQETSKATQNIQLQWPSLVKGSGEGLANLEKLPDARQQLLIPTSIMAGDLHRQLSMLYDMLANCLLWSPSTYQERRRHQQAGQQIKNQIVAVRKGLEEFETILIEVSDFVDKFSQS